MRRALSLAGFYLIWNYLFHLVALTLLTYFLSRGGTRLGELSELLASNQILLTGLSAGSFIFLLVRLGPLTHISASEFITSFNFENEFYPAFLKGTLLGSLWVFIFLAGGIYKYLGFFVQSETPWIATFNLILKVISLFFLIYVDAYVFQEKFIALLKGKASPLRSILLSAGLFSLGKMIAFYLGWSYLVSLLLLGIALGLRSLTRGFRNGAGLLFGFLFVTHALFSLPLLGNDNQGIILLRYQFHWDVDAPWVRLICGGAGGPVAGVLFQAALVIEIVFRFVRQKKTLSGSFPLSLR